jgi:hypothetical protein
MAESLVVSGLVSKRSEVAGQIISYQAEITRLQESLSHLDGSIKLFAPEYDLRTIKSKRTNISSSIRIDRQHPLQSRRRRLGPASGWTETFAAEARMPASAETGYSRNVAATDRCTL